MSSIPSNLARIPTLLSSQIMSGSLHRSNQAMLNMQMQLASGKAINRPSDNPIGASQVGVLDDILERRDQRLRNLSHAEAVMNVTDAALNEATNIVMEAKSIGLSQIGVGSDAETRKSQAVVIDSMINELITIANSKYQGVHVFGGKATGTPPMIGMHGGYQYVGQGDGMETDLGLASGFPITTSAEKAFGAMSTRVQGKRDLDPIMTGETRLQDLNGARGQGITKGTLAVTIDDGAQSTLSVDLSDAHTVQDVIDALQQAIATVDAGAVVQIDPDTGNRFEIIPSAGVTVSISDPASDAVAADLGLSGTYEQGGNTTGEDVDPRLTEMTRLSSLTDVATPLGTIRITNAGQTREVDLSDAKTVRDVMAAVEGLGIGVRVEINEDADRLNFVNTLSTGFKGAMSIAEVAGGTTATDLGVRSFTYETNLSDFRHGLGVEIRSGSVDPLTGDPTPEKDVDFEITLKDGRSFEVDLAGAVTVGNVLDLINQAAADEGIAPAEFQARLVEDGNGIALTDNTPPPGNATSVTPLNGSHAADHLGIEGATSGATLAGEDRATVAVESVISHLIALRDALKANDESGISLATERLEGGIDRLTGARGEVGARAQRVVQAITREEDLQLQDRNLKSQVQDLDFIDAAIKFSSLQQQLQAGLQTAGRMSALSLLDFLR